ncbi:hypothetical protein KAU86_05370 [bacterium]|nr:hypothetical protein [bacterium]MCK4325399.1 hypothetical protein [bacterium]MCK4437360.1 hypothetical protein [bacterium]
MRKLVGVAILTSLLLASGLAYVHPEEEGRGGLRGRRGRGGEIGPGKGYGMRSEAMQAEFQRHRKALKALREKTKALRQEIREAVRAARKGEEKPTAEEIQEIIQGYKGKANDIATRIASERITHHEETLSIVKKEKEDMVDRLTKRLLHPGRGRKGQGDG